MSAVRTSRSPWSPGYRHRSALTERFARVGSVDARCLPSAERAGLKCGGSCQGTHNKAGPGRFHRACKGPQPRRGRLSEAGLPLWREPTRIEAAGPDKISCDRPWCVRCSCRMMAESTVSVGLSAAHDRHNVLQLAGDGPMGRLADGRRQEAHCSSCARTSRAQWRSGPSGRARAPPSPSPRCARQAHSFATSSAARGYVGT